MQKPQRWKVGCLQFESFVYLWKNFSDGRKVFKAQPEFKFFFQGGKAVAVCGIQALPKLVTYYKSINSTSLAEEFDQLCENKGAVKHISLHHEQCFTKLGYSAALLSQALPLLQQLLYETIKTNLLVQACKLYT